MAARWVLLCRIPALGPDDAEAQEPGADFSIELRAPPRVTFLTVAQRVHPNPSYIDPHPYLIAAGPSGALFSFATAPRTSEGPRVDRVLVVAHHFHRAAGGQQLAATSTATAKRIPRSALSTPYMSIVAGTIGLVSSPVGEPDRYVIAELRLQFYGASDRAKILLFFAGYEPWLELDIFVPMEAQGRPFVSADVLHHDGHKLWWIDLSWGLLSCIPGDNALLFHPLPPGRAVDSYDTRLHDDRCLCESDHKLRFVEIIRGPLDAAGRVTASVSMWTRIPEPDDSGRTARWDKDYEVSFAKIWKHDSYKATQLPKEIPAIVLVSPIDPELVYFFFRGDKRLVGINVREHEVKVVEFITEQLPGDREPPTVPASRIRVLPWILPPTISDGNCILWPLLSCATA
jgi:hypothetical protein